jgi:hypothetical protein
VAGVPRGNGARSGRNQQDQADDDGPGIQENGEGKNADKKEPFALKPGITQKEVQRVMGIQDKWPRNSWRRKE